MNNLLTDSLLPDRERSMDGDIEYGTPVPILSELEMEGFFKQVHEIDKQIEKLSNLSTKLQDANEGSKAILNTSAMKTIKHGMAKDIDEVLKIAFKTKTRLNELDKDNLVNRQKPGCGMGSAVDRTRTATTISLKEKLMDRVTDFQFLREAINKEYHEDVQRMIFTVQIVNQLIETGNSEQILQKAILEQGGEGKITDIIAELQEHHDAVKDLERKLLELQQIFLDMSVFVEAQGDIVDNIELQVSGAADDVQSGTAALINAKKMRKNSKKWIFIAVIILLIVIAVIIVAFLQPWNKSS